MQLPSSEILSFHSLGALRNTLYSFLPDSLLYLALRALLSNNLFCKTNSYHFNSTSPIRNIVVSLAWSIQLHTFSGNKFVYHAKSLSPIRNIVVLLAWSASQCSLFLPKLNLDISSTGRSSLSFSVFLLFKPSSVLPQEVTIK